MATNLVISGTSLSKENFYKLHVWLLYLLGKLLQFLSVSSLSVGISGFFATLSAYILLGISPNFQICFAAFLRSFSLYNLNKLTDVKEDAVNMPQRLKFSSGERNFIIAYSVVAYTVCMLLTFINRPSSVAITLFPLVANALYGSRLLPGVLRLKTFPL